MPKGNAGTPCVNKDGNVIGMILIRDGQIKKIVPSKEILEFIKEISSGDVLAPQR